MTGLFVILFGVMPVIVLGLLAFVPLLAGLAMLFDQPGYGALLTLWATAGIVGSLTLMRASRDSFDENTSLGLLAGIAAAAPLAGMVLINWHFPSSLFVLYWTGGPIIVACGFLGKRLLP